MRSSDPMNPTVRRAGELSVALTTAIALNDSEARALALEDAEAFLRGEGEGVDASIAHFAYALNAAHLANMAVGIAAKTSGIPREELMGQIGTQLMRSLGRND